MADTPKDVDDGLEKLELFNVDDDNKDVSYEGKLSMFESDFETLYEFALSKGLSFTQIRSCLSPFLGEKSSLPCRTFKDSSRSLLVVSLLVAVVSIAFTLPVSRRWLHAHIKLAAVKSLDYVDWKPIYDLDCLLTNPFLNTEEKNLTKEDCAPCVVYDDVLMLTDADVDTVSDSLHNDIPFVVTDATKTWGRHENGSLKFSLPRLQRLLKENKVLVSTALQCEQVSHGDVKNLRNMFGRMENNSFPEKFHMSWENCEILAAKIFRMLAKRPYFLPPFAEISSLNQVIVAKGKFEDEDFSLPQPLDSASWMIVVEGEMLITLKPDEQCLQFGCADSSFTIKAGEAVVVPLQLWNMTYSPTSDEFTLGFASTLLWD